MSSAYNTISGQGFAEPQTLHGQLLKEMHRVQNEVVPRLGELGAVGNESFRRIQRICNKAALFIENNNRIGMQKCLGMLGEY